LTQGNPTTNREFYIVFKGSISRIRERILKQENNTMTQAISKEHLIIERVRQLPSEKQQEVLDFIEFLQFQLHKQSESTEEKEPISAYEAAKEFAGCVDFGTGDLSTNKEYLKGLGKK
jgi:hypothetical protein